VRCVKIILATKVTAADLATLVRNSGGRWTDGQDGGGVLSRGDAAIYVSLTPSIQDSAERYSDEEVSEFRDMLGGGSAVSLVAIEIGHAPGSDQLARQLALRIATQWAGVQDWRDAD
jgi:hypothetical protein